MIFIGDIAFPPGFKGFEMPDVFQGQTVIGNLEGTMVPADRATEYLEKHVVFNDTSVLQYFNDNNIKVVSLANNHILDVPEEFEYSLKTLDENGILRVGAGRDLEEASKPLKTDIDGQSCVFLAFGWNVISCPIASRQKPGVNPLDPKHVLCQVSEAKAKYPDSKIILLMHWDYELEIYPQPMHRQLAFACIDRGADAIIGSHTHCVQDIEIYKNAPIVYGLGNWCFPWGYYWDGKLKFPEISKRQLAFEWEPISNKMKAHYLKYDGELGIRKADVIQKSAMDQKAVFTGYGHVEYVRWFKRNRRKKKALPVYSWITRTTQNTMFDTWVKIRQNIIGFLLKLGLKGAPW